MQIRGREQNLHDERDFVLKAIETVNRGEISVCRRKRNCRGAVLVLRCSALSNGGGERIGASLASGGEDRTLRYVVVVLPDEPRACPYHHGL